MLRRSRGQALRFSALSRVAAKSPGWRKALAAAAPFLAIAGLALAVAAAARPRVPFARETRNVDAIAIMIAIDVSGSMSALDLTPPGVRYSEDTTRLAVVKRLFADFVEKRPDDLVGVVSFGTFATVRAPLTADHRTLLSILGAIGIPDDPEEGETALGDGLSVALLRLKDAKPSSKIVVLLSDGACNNGVVDPDDAAEAASKMGARVYTIGVGTNAAVAPRIVRDSRGGKMVVSYPSGFDEAQLRDIARKTGGKYYAANDSGAIEKALKEIDKLEKTQLEAEVWDRWHERFPAFLLAAAACLLLSAVFALASCRRLP